jgi:hypothetical protein
VHWTSKSTAEHSQRVLLLPSSWSSSDGRRAIRAGGPKRRPSAATGPQTPNTVQTRGSTPGSRGRQRGAGRAQRAPPLLLTHSRFNPPKLGHTALPAGGGLGRERGRSVRHRRRLRNQGSLRFAARCGTDSIAAEPIADAGFGEEPAGIAGIGLELFAQVMHVHAQVARIADIGRAPNFAQQLLVRHYVAFGA